MCVFFSFQSTDSASHYDEDTFVVATGSMIKADGLKEGLQLKGTDMNEESVQSVDVQDKNALQVSDIDELERQTNELKGGENDFKEYINGDSDEESQQTSQTRKTTASVKTVRTNSSANTVRTFSVYNDEEDDENGSTRLSEITTGSSKRSRGSTRTSTTSVPLL